LGESEFHQRVANDIKVIPVELFMNLDKPAERFVSFPGQPGLTALQSDDRRETVVKLPPMKGRPRFSGAFEPSQQTPPPRPV